MGVESVFNCAEYAIRVITLEFFCKLEDSSLHFVSFGMTDVLFKFGSVGERERLRRSRSPTLPQNLNILCHSELLPENEVRQEVRNLLFNNQVKSMRFGIIIQKLIRIKINFCLLY
jgi:hypothetical protein